ncbi:MAG: ABC transporter permease [bacterium]
MNRDVLARIAFRSTFVMSAAFLLAPLIVLIVFSFNADRFPSLPWKGFTLGWYGEFYEDASLHDALARSCIVAAAAALVSVVLGFVAAYGVRHWPGPRAHLLVGFIFFPCFLPYFLLGMATAVYFSFLGIGGGLVPVILIHVVVCAPIAFAVIRIRLEDISRDIEEAAVNLGAGHGRLIWEVILPGSRTALVGAFLLAFAFSWNEFLISWFHSGFQSTLPVAIWSMVRAAISPEINAIGALVFLTSIVLVSTGYFIALAPARRRTAGRTRNTVLSTET